jgi:hypothetical protein
MSSLLIRVYVLNGHHGTRLTLLDHCALEESAAFGLGVTSTAGNKEIDPSNHSSNGTPDNIVVKNERFSGSSGFKRIQWVSRQLHALFPYPKRLPILGYFLTFHVYICAKNLIQSLLDENTPHSTSKMSKIITKGFLSLLGPAILVCADYPHMTT